MFDQEKTLVASTWEWRGEHPPRDYAPRLQLARQFFPTTREDRHRQVPGFAYLGNRKPSAGGAASGASASAAARDDGGYTAAGALVCAEIVCVPFSQELVLHGKEPTKTRTEALT